MSIFTEQSKPGSADRDFSPRPARQDSAPESRTKKRGRPFEPGNKFSQGRPKGSRNKKTVLALQLFEQHSPALMALAINQSREDPQMLRTFLGRILPRSRDLPLQLGRLPLTTLGDLNRASQQIVKKLCAGQITASEGAEICRILEDRRRVLETEQLEQRLSALERREAAH